MTQDYEIHVELLPDFSRGVTTDVLDDVNRLVRPVCEALSFTMPTLFQDSRITPKEAERLPRNRKTVVVCTAHRATQREAEAACTTFAEACRTAGIRVAREKIEHVIHDVRYS